MVKRDQTTRKIIKFIIKPFEKLDIQGLEQHKKVYEISKTPFITNISTFRM